MVVHFLTSGAHETGHFSMRLYHFLMSLLCPSPWVDEVPWVHARRRGLGFSHADARWHQPPFFSFLRHALDIREHYERKLERANNLYMELSAVMLQLELKEKELQRFDEIHSKILSLAHGDNFYKATCLSAGGSSPWIRSIQGFLSTTAPGRAALPTVWTSSSRRETSHRNCPQESGTISLVKTKHWLSGCED